MTIESNKANLGFTYYVAKNGTVIIDHHGKLATVLRGKKSVEFIVSIQTLSFAQQQQLMARLTGNYKRGNERLSKRHPKNRR